MDHLEADAGPTGASVRNFGLVWVSGRRSGAELEVARRARRRWEEVGAAVPGIGFRPMSSLTVAGDDDARAVMEAFARQPDAAARSISFLEPDEARACNPAVRGDVTGALHCSGGRGGRAPPARSGALRAHLAAVHGERYRFHPGCRVVAAAAARARRHDGNALGGRPGRARHRRRLRPPPRIAGRRGPPAPGPAADARDGALRLARSRRRSPTPTPCATTRPTSRRRWPGSGSRPRWRPSTTCSCCWSSAPTAG